MKWMCALVLCGGSAAAQTFPADGNFAPLRCGNLNMFDPLRDQPGAVAERDLVGDEPTPAGFRAVDAQFLYLRMRLDGDPSMGAGALRPFAWGFAFDTNNDASNYEALLILDGQTNSISLYQNTATTVANSPADPADQPALSTGTFAQRGRIRAATSTFGGDADQFLDLAVSWADLGAVGIAPTTPVRMWVGTSTTPDRLDDDIACHDGAGGAARLMDVATDRGALDPNAMMGGMDGGADGSVVGQTRAVEGGPGCAMVGSGGGMLPLLLLLLLRRRLTRRTSL